jgi:hypothetical protein
MWIAMHAASAKARSFNGRDSSRRTMNRPLTVILGAAFCTMLYGCGPQGESYQSKPTPATKSLIYIYRPYKFLSAQATPMITCGHESFELDAGGFYEFEEDPGTLTCAVATDANSEYKFDAHASERYFIKEEVDASGLTTRVRLVPMDADVASDEIKECSRQGIKN